MNHPFCFPSFFLTAFVQVAFLAPPGLLAGQSSLSLEEVTQKALARNPAVAAARARWRMATQRIPQEAAWEDPKLNFRSLLGRFVQIPANGFTDQTVSIEQSIPLSGKNRSRERAAAAEAVAAFQDLRRQELELVFKTRSAFLQLSNDYELLELNQTEGTALSQTVDSSRTKFEVGAQPESDLLTAQIKKTLGRRDRAESLDEGGRVWVTRATRAPRTARRKSGYAGTSLADSPNADLYEKSLIPNAKQNVSANQSDYEADKTLLQNLLSSQRNLWEIEAAYHQHLTDYQIALAELESLVGSNLRFFGGVPEVSK